MTDLAAFPITRQRVADSVVVARAVIEYHPNPDEFLRDHLLFRLETYLDTIRLGTRTTRVAVDVTVPRSPWQAWKQTHAHQRLIGRWVAWFPVRTTTRRGYADVELEGFAAYPDARYPSDNPHLGPACLFEQQRHPITTATARSAQ